MAYPLAADVKTYLDIAGSGDDTLITALIARAVAFIEAEVGFSFNVGSNTDRFLDLRRYRDPTDRRILYLDTWLATVNTVTNKADATTPETIAATEYITLPQNAGPFYGLRLLDSSTYDWDYEDDPEKAVKISGAWGWSATPPNDIAHAVIRLSAWLYRQRSSSVDIDRPFIVEGVTILPSAIPKDVGQILNRYKTLTRFGMPAERVW